MDEQTTNLLYDIFDLFDEIFIKFSDWQIVDQSILIESEILSVSPPVLQLSL